jgi:hypothetical protein
MGYLSVTMTSRTWAWIASGPLLDPSTTVLRTVDGGVQRHRSLETPPLKAYDVEATLRNMANPPCSRD